MTYAWTNISSDDFESVVRDLLQERHSITFERFAPGPDGGIDLRAFTGALKRRRKPWLVQCKHYPEAAISSVLAAARSEASKVAKLRPARYTFATSRRLTKKNKESIAKLFAPLQMDPQEDILGRDDLENFLGLYESVERRHFKLWLASTQTLERINSAALINRSDLYREQLLKKARLFVEHSAISRAREVLKEHSVCVVSGPPGVGKTTLGDILTLDYLADGFDLFVVSSDVEEAEAAFRSDRRQLFVYDDFLGRTSFAEKLNKNEDARLVQFMRGIRDSGNKRFILTTREYLLRSARMHYDRLDASDLDLFKCVVEIGGYKRTDKARILYNHIYWASALTKEDVVSLTNPPNNWKRLVDHPRYNPRLIETAVNELVRRREATV
jgi:Restriction endonuclease